MNRLKLTSVPGGNYPHHARPLAIGMPPRSPSSPSPLSRSSSVRSGTPTPQSSQRSSYFPRPASTAPMFHGGHGSGLYVGSAPTSNTFASAMKLHTSPSKPKVVSSASDSPPEDEKPHERWMPTSDDDSALSDVTKLSYGTSSAARSISTSSSHPKWMPRFQLPPVTV